MEEDDDDDDDEFYNAPFTKCNWQRYVFALNGPLCRRSPCGWLMLLTETCRRSNKAHVNQRMAVLNFCDLKDDKARLRQPGSINAVPSLKSSTVPELMSYFQQHVVKFNWRLFEMCYTLQWCQPLVSDLIKQHKNLYSICKNLPPQFACVLLWMCVYCFR